MKQQILSMMLEDIHHQGERVAAELPVIEKQIADLEAKSPLADARRVFFVGCGDSYYAGMAARLAFQEWTGVWAEAIESLEFRYLADRLPEGSLVIGISVSGQVERTLDCLVRAKEQGALTLGITGTPHSRIYSAAEHVIDMGIRVREPGPVPMTVYFLANIVTLYQLALSLGLTKGTLAAEEAQTIRQSLSDALGKVRQVAAHNHDKVMEYVETLNAPQPLVLVGGGPNWATAHFGVAKLLEAALVLGVVQELEEWAHEQYFLTGPELHTVLIGAEGIVKDRLGPTAQAVRNLKGSLALVVPEKTDLGVEAGTVWEYPTGVPEPLSPILTKISLELLAYSLAKYLDRRPFDYDNPTRKSVVERTIYKDGESAEMVNRRRRGSNDSDSPDT